MKEIKLTVTQGLIVGIFFSILFMASFWGLATAFEEASDAYSAMMCNYIG